MGNPFKVGDKVSCISSNSIFGYFGKVGEVYTVSDVDGNDILVLENPIPRQFLYHKRFVKVKPNSEKKEKAIKILNELKKQVDKYQKLVDDMD